MKYNEFNQLRDSFFKTASEVSDNKSIEYTISNDDKLYNFKHVADRLGITPKQALMVYVLKHVDALANDAKTGKTHSDETTYNRCLDVANYMVLLAAIDKENPHASKTKSNGTSNSEGRSTSKNESESTQWSDISRSA
jgi:predicted lipase